MTTGPGCDGDSVAMTSATNPSLEDIVQGVVHGSGCPVCVTPLEVIDEAHAIAADPRVVSCSFGDMLRVPGSSGDPLSLEGKGVRARALVREVFEGIAKPTGCAAFGRECTPEHPLGATMVSSEGACAAYHRYGRRREAAGAR